MWKEINNIENELKYFFNININDRKKIIKWNFKRFTTDSCAEKMHIKWNEILFLIDHENYDFDYTLLYKYNNDINICKTNLINLKYIKNFVYLTGPFFYTISLLRDIGMIKNDKINFKFFNN